MSQCRRRHRSAPGSPPRPTAAASPVLLVVEPDDLLLLTDDACLAKRRQPVIDGQQFDAGLGCAPPERQSAVIVADEGDQRGVSAERHDIGGRVCGATELLPAACTLNTGTGASGEIRLQSPIRYSSRIASPNTSTRQRGKAETCRASESEWSERAICSEPASDP